MRLASEDLSSHIVRLARLGRQRDFSLSRFSKSLSTLARNGERGEVLRQLLAEWTGIPFEAQEALERWAEIERLIPGLREKVGAPLGLQTVLLHHFHSRKGLMKEPRLVSEADLAVLRVNAITDPLTGLYNRRFLIDHLTREISRAERSGGILAVGMMDLKGFKSINDRFGHAIGDRVLQIFADSAMGVIRRSDLLGRLGGEEFAAVLTNASRDKAVALAEQIRCAFAEATTEVDGVPVRATLSIGVVLHQGAPLDVAELLLQADHALYSAKERGRNRIEVASFDLMHKRNDATSPELAMTKTAA